LELLCFDRDRTIQEELQKVSRPTPNQSVKYALAAQAPDRKTATRFCGRLPRR